MAVSISKSKKTRSTVPKLEWAQLREEYINYVLAGNPQHFEKFAVAHNINYGTLKNRASRDKWNEEASIRLKRQEDMVSTKLVERSTLAIDGVRDKLAFVEAEVRNRHVQIARNLQVKAYTRIKEIPSGSLSMRDALDLLRLGLSEERKGLGLPDEYVVSHHNHNLVVSQAQEVFERNLAMNEAVQSAVAKAIHIIDGAFTKVPNAGKS